jgi:hypothetical protein
MSLPTTLAQSTSIQPVLLICLEKSMRDKLSVILTQWAELERKFSEFRELITFEGNNMNVTIYKKQFCDLQLEWKELNKKSNFIFEYEQCHKGVLKRSCPPVHFSDCICTNSTPWISQSKNGMASEDPISQSIVCNGIHGNYYYCVTFDIPTEYNEVYDILYYPLYSGWDFPEYPFLFKKPNEAACWAMSIFKRDGLGNVWGQGKFPQFLSFVGQVIDEEV